MICLKQLLIDCGISQMDFARDLKICRRSLGKILSHGKLPSYPVKRVEFIEKVEKWAAGDARCKAWFENNNLNLLDIWQEYEKKHDNTRKRAIAVNLQLGDPLKIEDREDIEVITINTMKYFKLFKNPFENDVTSHKDIYLSPEHRFLKEMMLDSAKYGGFVAVVGGVGSGKSTMRKAVAEQLIDAGIKVVYPLIIDKARVSPSSLIDAIIMDISDEIPKRSLEQKTRQAVRLLKARAENGMRQVLIIEEAHLVDKRAFKALKQIYELETGFEKLIGIILIGQPELLKKLDEVSNPDIREVTRRITTAEIEGLGKDVKPYLEHKFKRIGKSACDILDGEVFEAITKRLERISGRKKIDRSFPLAVNNLVARAMNMAAHMGESKVSADLILSC
jgi:type II secretory pathway predicted ATPase ExeA